MDFTIGISSLRLSDVTPEMLALLAEGGEQSVTLAPETGSDRLRFRSQQDLHQQ